MSSMRRLIDPHRPLPFDEIELLRREVEAYFGRRPADPWPHRERVETSRSGSVGMPRAGGAGPA